MASKKGNARSNPRAAAATPAAAPVATPAAAPVVATPAAAPVAPVATPPAPVAVRQATKQAYTAGAKLPNPRTNGETGQNSNTQAAWQACYACLVANGGVATHDQLAAALQAVGLQFKTYVPYFANRTHWLAYATPVTPAAATPAATPAAPAAAPAA